LLELRNIILKKVSIEFFICKSDGVSESKKERKFRK